MWRALVVPVGLAAVSIVVLVTVAALDLAGQGLARMQEEDEEEAVYEEDLTEAAGTAAVSMSGVDHQPQEPVAGDDSQQEQAAGALTAVAAQEPTTWVDEACSRTAPLPPLPAPNSAGAAEFWQMFRAPLPPVPVWDPPGPKRVGLQAGHWRVEEAPEELRNLGHGTSGGGKAEWEVNLDIAQRTARLLTEYGVEVDVLPATVPPRYRAHVFVALHADGDATGTVTGYKIARAVFSAIPEVDDRLVALLYETYGQATGLRRDDLRVSRRMTAYYAFNSRRYCHAIAPGVPAAIIEMGFLTSASDRRILVSNPDAAARGIANGVLRFLGLAQ